MDKVRTYRSYGSDNKNVYRRWALEMLEAVADGDAEKMKMALETEGAFVDQKIIAHSRGAAFEFAGVGFYDDQAKAYALPLVPTVIDGDTILLLAFRQFDAAVATVLLDFDASLSESNESGETGIDFLWKAKMALQDIGKESAEIKEKIQPQINEYENLFQRFDSELKQFHFETHQSARDQIVRIYRKYCPDRVRKIDMQLEQFYGREMDLVQVVQDKYES